MSSTNEPSDVALPPPRVPTGVSGLDLILGGGLFRGGVYIVVGQPGTGKTIFGHQLAFHHVAAGGRVVYATLLSETHGRLLTFMKGMRFFDEAAVGDKIAYVNGYTSLESDGLAGLMLVVRTAVREQGASILIIDGMSAAATLGPSESAYKKFIQELQTWVEMIGCTVLLLSSSGSAMQIGPEETMVDGVIELEVRPLGRRRIRQLFVTKLRGSGYLEGQHTYEISSGGIDVYPRLEPAFGGEEPIDGDHQLSSFGVEGLDAMLGGGVTAGSTTMILGASGTGKSILGQHFLEAGLRAGETVAAFGFFANPPTLLRIADERGMGFGAAAQSGRLHVLWQPPVERLLDKVGWEILRLVGRTRAARIFVDSIEALRESEDGHRLNGFFAVLSQELRRLGVTTVFAAETVERADQKMAPPVHRLSAVTQNLILLQVTEVDGKLERRITVQKTRDRAHDLRLAPFAIGERGVVVDRRR